jgi:hypothetical protein
MEEVSKTTKLLFSENVEVILNRIGELNGLQIYESEWCSYDFVKSEMSILTVKISFKAMTEKEKKVALFKTGKGKMNESTSK